MHPTITVFARDIAAFGSGVIFLGIDLRTYHGIGIHPLRIGIEHQLAIGDEGTRHGGEPVTVGEGAVTRRHGGTDTLIVGQQTVRHYQLDARGGIGVRLVPAEESQIRGFRLRYLGLLSTNGEGKAALVALEVAQGIDQVVVALLREIDDAAIDGAEDAQRVARLDKRLHVPRTVLAPLVVIAPGIHEAVARSGDIVHDGTEHLLTIDRKDRLADAKMIGRPLHVVISPEGETNLAPSFQRAREAVAIDRKRLFGSRAAEDPLPCLRIHHQPMGTRRYGVADEVADEVAGIQHVPRLGVVDLKMQMRARAVACITA